MKNIIKNLLKFLLFFSIGAIILYLVYRGQNAAYQDQCRIDGIPQEECSLINKVLTDFASVNYFWIVLVLITFTLSNVSRTLKWNMLLKPLGYVPKFYNAFLSILLGYFANLGIPRIGEVVRAGTLSQYENIPVEKVMGTIVVDRIIDVITLLLVTGLVVLLEFDTISAFFNEHVSFSDRFGGMQGLVLYGMILGAIGLGVFWIFRKSLEKTAIYQKIIQLLMGFIEGIKTIGRLERPWLFIFHSLSIWVLYFLMIYLCFFSFKPTANLTPMVGLVIFVFGAWGIVVPSPGGMGTYQWIVQTALVMYGLRGDDAFSFANIAFFSISLGCNVILGLIALIVLPILNNRQAEPEITATSSESGQ